MYEVCSSDLKYDSLLVAECEFGQWKLLKPLMRILIIVEHAVIKQISNKPPI